MGDAVVAYNRRSFFADGHAQMYGDISVPGFRGIEGPVDHAVEVLFFSQAELADVIQEGLKARDAGDVETATAKLGRAVQLAAESGHEGTARLLAKVVDVVDAPTGTVRLKKQVAGVDSEMANVRSVKTVRVKKES